MNDNYVCNILNSMRLYLNNYQLSMLQTALYNSMSYYMICERKNEIMVVEDSWKNNLCDFLLEKQIEGKSTATLKQYKGHLYKMLSVIGKDISDITHSDIYDYLSYYKMSTNISNRSLENKRLVFSSFFNWAYKHNRINANPLFEGSKIKYDYTIKKAFSDEEMEKLIHACKIQRDLALIEFLYSSCVRVSELVSLNKTDIKFTEKELTVYGKGGKERITYINSRTYFHLKKYLDTRLDKNQSLFVSSKKPYNRLTVSGVESILHKLGKLAGVENVHPHRFRRTGATNALNRGMPIEEVSKLLGHKNIATTQIYCTVLQDNIKLSHQKYLSA